jgi:hypothetical protein
MRFTNNNFCLFIFNLFNLFLLIYWTFVVPVPSIELASSVVPLVSVSDAVASVVEVIFDVVVSSTELVSVDVSSVVVVLLVTDEVASVVNVVADASSVVVMILVVVVTSTELVSADVSSVVAVVVSVRSVLVVGVADVVIVEI